MRFASTRFRLCPNNLSGLIFFVLRPRAGFRRLAIAFPVRGFLLVEIVLQMLYFTKNV